MTTILAAVDHSPISAAVVARAGKLARVSKARVLLVTVMVPLVFVKEYAPPPEVLWRVSAGNEKAVQRRLATMERKLRAQGIPATSIILRGAPSPLILEQARRAKASFIVMGSHGHTAFYDLVAGSIVHGVLKRARCPVMIIPARHRR